MKIGAGSVDHDQIGGVSSDDHHAQLHAAAHVDGAADELIVEGLPSASSNVSASLKPDGTGGVEFVDTDHSELVGVTADQHHTQDHGDSHHLGGDDALVVQSIVDDLSLSQFITRIVNKLADETVNNSTTMQDDNDLKFTMLANREYAVWGMIKVNGNTTANLKISFTVPTGATAAVFVANPSTSAWGLRTQAADVFQDLDGNDQIMAFMGTIINGANVGEIAWEWAQNTQTVADTTFQLGSWMAIRLLP